MGYTKIIRFVKTTEAYFYEKDVYPKKRAGVNRRRRSAGYRSQRSIKRAKKAFFNLCKNHLDSFTELPCFITLTYHDQYEESPSLNDSYRHCNAFWKRAKEYFGKSISYISVPEYQTRGAVHYHALVWGFPASVREERATRLLQRAWRQGYCDVRFASYKSDALAGYLAKYFTKAYSDYRTFNRKTYTTSRNIQRPTEIGSNAISYWLSTYLQRGGLIDVQKYNTIHLGSVTKLVINN